MGIKDLENTSNDSIEVEEEGIVTAKTILKANDNTFYPAFLTLDMKQKGQIIGAYLIADQADHYDLIPFEIAKESIPKKKMNSSLLNIAP
ncbi:hypothetical protein [Cytobacillus purgationiresistens]|uniref:Uncharacterized protein affecting Mg2+/Co2+ transport n=1 Tax=Cytobacillus purgationiresistens TaxID=863449 RepID=A0ABU0AD04_9BACI|nr:hypothetical protein [Cytobacillus purgationiresistens]MDQ0269124.1 uncharacterized protein affecting Mg2+/Co2+ transport [Cytobacillus purgationiresistens]